MSAFLNNVLIRNARLLDPRAGTDSVGDLAIRDGLIVSVDSGPFEETFDAAGRWLIPGIVDLCARMREPGATQKGTMRSETHAALASGITAVCLPPDTSPVIDNTAMVNRVNRIAKKAAGAYVHMLGALTKGLGGEALAEISALKAAGCVGVSNGLNPVANALVARRALEYAASLGMTVHVVPLDDALANHGCAHEGAIATRLGLAAIPVAAEALAMRQWISLVEDTGARVHFGRLSSARAVELLASAKRLGLPVTADVAAHQLFMTDADLEGFNAMAHVIPPLRAASDRDALRAAVGSGLIDAICSDHQPHELDAKTNPLPQTEPGISALETLLPLSLRLVEAGLLTPLALAERLAGGPVRILGLSQGGFALDARADLCLVDPTEEWRLDGRNMLSAGRNTPFMGQTFSGRAIRVWRG
ncbi:dihydroorotase family protein [uncultured Nevskia sp.]|uniref:dihydroorotase n=1 Tax=uncultured Nevskia sp. TaxID=228950 RepID=UPI0025F84FF3|nr:dihydroorotase [uncultured Nevskia sp.]